MDLKTKFKRSAICVGVSFVTGNVTTCHNRYRLGVKLKSRYDAHKMRLSPFRGCSIRDTIWAPLLPRVLKNKVPRA